MLDKKLVDNAPGLLGEVCDWILSTSRYPLPTLALSAALPSVGVLMGRKVQTETGLRTNLYTIGLASSGSGKDQGRKCNLTLLGKDFRMGTPASAAGLNDGLARKEGVCLMQIDEFGRYLKSLSGSASSYEAKILTNMMLIYNAYDNVYEPLEYAKGNKDREEQEDIYEPCMGFYGLSVPQHFYGGLTNSDSFDGFLSRFLVFHTDDYPIHDNPNRVSRRIVPETLKRRIQYWLATEENVREIPFASNMWKEYNLECRKKAAESDDLIFRAFYNRAAEHVAKVALVACDGAGEIRNNILEWSIDVVESSLSYIVAEARRNVVANQFEAECRDVLSFIQEKGERTRRDIIRKFQKLKPRELTDVLNILEEGGEICYKEEKNHRNQTVKKYVTET